jgi:hypothetical protein
MYRQGNGRSAGRHSAPLPTPIFGRAAAKPALRRRQALRARGWGETNARVPFMPPEVWHEPTESGRGYRVVVEPAGTGYRHVVTEAEIRERLARLPAEFVRPLEVVQLSGMTRKKRSLPLYGMQWGAALYLYPIETGLIETYDAPPSPAQRTEARMYGGRWEQQTRRRWALVWTEETVKDFYLNNILLHELGHLLDNRNTRSVERERYAEWFAVEYGYRPTQATRRATSTPAVRRHG